MRAELEINRDIGKSEMVAEYHGHTDVNKMLERFFEVVARHVVTVKAA